MAQRPSTKLLGAVALLLLALAPSHSPGEEPSSDPQRIWRVSVDADGSGARPVYAGIHRKAVLLAGVAGEVGDSQASDLLVSSRRRRDGSERWAHRYDSGGSEIAAAAAVGGSSLFVVGRVDPVDQGEGPSVSSFVRALRTSNGGERWSATSGTGADDLAESLSDVAVSGKRVLVVGQRDQKLLVRAHRAGSGAMLWQDNEESGAISDRADRVIVAGDTLYVLGTRHTVGGRSTPYVLRAHDVADGARRWESVFGGELNFVGGLGMADGTLVVAGHVYQLGLGRDLFEVYGIDSADGSILWTDRPFPKFGISSVASDLLITGTDAVVAGTMFRARRLPVMVSYDATTGAQNWSADFDDLGSGSLAAMAAVDGVVIATGDGSDRHNPDREEFLARTHGRTDGTSGWSRTTLLGSGDSMGTAATSEENRVVLAGTIENAGGARDWTAALYELPAAGRNSSSASRTRTSDKRKR